MSNPEYNNFHRRLQRLRERRDWLIRTLEQTADTVMITDREGVIEFVNEAFQETTGYSAEEVLGRTPRLLKSDKHNKQFFKELWTTLLAGKPFRGVIINRKKSGQLYSSAQTICSMKDKNGEITHFIDIMRNITELRRQQQHKLSLQTAHEAQERLNTTVASWPGFDIAGSVWPAMLTGGDYFDFIAQPDGCRCVAIGDVSGKGFSAALMMAECRAYVRSYAEFESNMGAILNRVNNPLVGDLSDDQFVTLLLARLDHKHQWVEYASAGHIPCYLLRASGEIGHVLESTGPPLGLFGGNRFHSHPAIPLNYGDALVLLSDGVTEATNIDGAEFGASRALEFVKSHLQDSPTKIVQGIRESVCAFTGGAPQTDDISSVVCKIVETPTMHRPNVLFGERKTRMENR